MKTKTFFFSLIVAMCAFVGFNACNPAITPDEPNVSDKDTAVVTPQDTVPTDTIPSDTIPILPQDTIPTDTIIIPQDTIPADTIPVVPEDTIVVVEPETYTVTYMLDDAIYETQTYTEGETIVLPAEPTREGYTFAGWENVPATMPDNDIEIYGSWEINSYTITYMNNGEKYCQQMYEYGATITPPENPTGTGTFNGWSPALPSTMPARDLTVTAQWQAPVEYAYYGMFTRTRPLSNPSEQLRAKTQEELNDILNSSTSVELTNVSTSNPYTDTRITFTEEYQMFYVLIPASVSNTAQFYNGVSPSAFAGTYCDNGEAEAITIGTKQYKVYGQYFADSVGGYQGIYIN